MTTSREIELKLRIPSAAVRQLLRDPALRPLKRDRARTAELLSIYFDTPELRLARAGIALRLRHQGRRWLQTVKGPADGDSGGGLAVRPEHEWLLTSSVARPAIDFAKLATTPYAAVIDKAARKGALEPRVVTAFTRTRVPLAFPDRTTATLCVDVGEVRADTEGTQRGLREAIAEIELELEAGSASRLFELARVLADRLPLEVETRSKVERGFALLAPIDVRPVHAEPIQLSAAASAADALAAILRSCLRQIEANAAGVLHADDPEWIHQMRVGVRRLRSALGMLRKHVDRSALRPLDEELRWLAVALASARDLDVFLHETLAAAEAAGRHARDGAFGDALSLLSEHARSRLAEARAEARAAVASRRFQRLLLSIGAFASAPLPATGAQAEALLQPAEHFAAALLTKRHRKLHRAGKDIVSLSPAERHAVRIEAKKLRYASEFFASLFPVKRSRTYRKVLARLQDALGKLNDAAVGATLASDLSGPGASAAAVFAGWAAAWSESNSKALDGAWQAFVETEPFWLQR